MLYTFISKVNNVEQQTQCNLDRYWIGLETKRESTNGKISAEKKVALFYASYIEFFKYAHTMIWG